MRRTTLTHERAAWAALTLSALALGLAAAGWLRDGAPGPGPAPDRAPRREIAADAPAAAQDLLDLRERLARLENRADRTPALDQAHIEELVEAALAARGAAAAGAKAGAAADPGQAVTIQSLVQELAQTGNGPRRDELWQQLRKLGGVDAAVALFERLAAENPDSPDAQTALGAAYIEQMLQATDDAQRIALGEKIDAQFDRALALQPDHWEARFRKAVGLSYGSAVSGRQREAIGQFERLVQQQASLPAQPGFSQTYLYLGRLYEQQGDHARAMAIWQQGLQRHPQDPELQQLLAAH